MWRRTAEAAEADAAAWKAEANRIREERDGLAEDHDAQRYAAQTAARRFTDADGELAAARTRITQLTEALTEERQVSESLARQIHEMAEQLRGYQSVDDGRESWRSRHEAERKRGDRLQRELDAALGLEKGVPVDRAPWQPGFQKPKPDTKGAAS